MLKCNPTFVFLKDKLFQSLQENETCAIKPINAFCFIETVFISLRLLQVKKTEDAPLYNCQSPSAAMSKNF